MQKSNRVHTFTSVMRWPKLVRGIRVLTGDVGITGDSLNENVGLRWFFHSLHRLRFRLNEHLSVVHWYLLYCVGWRDTCTIFICVNCVLGDVTHSAVCPIMYFMAKCWPIGCGLVGGTYRWLYKQQICPSSIQPQEGTILKFMFSTCIQVESNKGPLFLKSLFLCVCLLIYLFMYFIFYFIYYYYFINIIILINFIFYLFI